MKEVPRYKESPHKRPRKDRLVRGVLIGRASPVFFTIESTSKSKVDKLAFVHK